MGLLGNISDISLGGKTTMEVGGVATYYSHSFKIGLAEFFGLWIIQSTSPVLTISLEQSAVLPATEEASDANWVVPTGTSAIYTARAATTAEMFSLSPVPMPYARLKIAGTGANGASATLQAKIFTQGNW